MKNKSKLNLKPNPTLADFQKYEFDMEVERGFVEQSILQKCIMLGEEVGELFKAIRKSEGVKVDQNSQIGEIPEELADIFIYVLSIANKFDIDLEKAFRDKEEINKQRQWEKI